MSNTSLHRLFLEGTFTLSFYSYIIEVSSANYQLPNFYPAVQQWEAWRGAGNKTSQHCCHVHFWLWLLCSSSPAGEGVWWRRYPGPSCFTLNTTLWISQKAWLLQALQLRGSLPYSSQCSAVCQGWQQSGKYMVWEFSFTSQNNFSETERVWIANKVQWTVYTSCVQLEPK